MKNPLVMSVIALVGGIVVGWLIGSSRQMYAPLVSQTPAGQYHTLKEHVFISDMAKLWEDHITWTRLWIMDYASNNNFADADQNRLMKNQEDIGNAIKVYYGDDASNKLTTLLKTHISGAVAIVKAAKANDSAALAKANTDWYTNANQIADFLAKANANWPDTTLRSMMKLHLDFTKQEATDILSKNYEGSVSDYDKVHNEILMMSDALSTGIIKQFPDSFK